MSELDNNQARLTKLHDSAIKSSDDHSFFTYLFKYLKTINDDMVLYLSAWSMFLETYHRDFKSDKDLPSLSKALKSLDRKKINELGALFYKKVFVDEKMHLDYTAGTRTYYCWLSLNTFYVMYGHKLSPDKLLALTKEQSGKTKNTFNLKLPNNSIEKLLPGLTEAFDNQRQDTKFHKREDFSLFLDTFHTDFSYWLQRNVEEVDKTGRVKPPNMKFEGKHGSWIAESDIDDSSKADKAITLRLNFDDIYPIVTNVNTDEIYDDFGWLVDDKGPAKLILWCWNNKKDVTAYTSSLKKEGLITSKGISDTLRGSAFHPKDGALRAFVEISGKPQKIRLKSEIKVDKQELNELLSKHIVNS